AATNQDGWYEINDGKSFDLSSYNNCELRFRLKQSGNYDDTVDVMVSTDGGGSSGTWTRVARYINNAATPDYAYDLLTVDLSSYDGNSSVNIAFRYTGNDGNSVGLDEISLIGTPDNPHIVYWAKRVDATGDWFASPGESNIPVSVSLKNLGSAASNVSVTLSTSEANASVLSTNNPWNAGSVGADAVFENASAPFYINVSSSASDGEILTFNLSITADGGYSVNRSFDIRVESTPKEWTIMVYIGGDNNLSPYINSDCDEMETVGSDANINIVAQIDGRYNALEGVYGYDDYLGNDWQTVRRYYIQSPNTNNGRIDHGFIQDLGELNSEDPEVVKQFIFWAVKNYPAKRYLLVLWNHGAGWAKKKSTSPSDITKGIIFDDTDGDNTGLNASNGELADIFEDVRDTIGHSLDILAFDACIVGMEEIEYEVLGYVDFLVHSEASVPGNGYDYAFIDAFADNPTALTECLADSIVSYYSREYSSTNSTLSNIKLDHTNVNLFCAVNFFAKELIDAGGKSNTDISNARNATQNFASDTIYKDFIDLYDFADEIDSRNINTALDTMAQKVKDLHGWVPPQPNRTVRKSWQYGFSGAHGIAIYYPRTSPASYLGGYYKGLKFSVQNVWSEFIYGSSRPTTQVTYYSNSINDYVQKGDTTSFYITVANLGTSAANNVWAKLRTFDRHTSIIVDSVGFPSVPAGGFATSSQQFKIVVNSIHRDSTFIPFELSVNGYNASKFILTCVPEANYPPDKPTSVSLFPYEYHGNSSSSTTPTLVWNVPSDADEDSLHFKVEWDDNPDFSSPISVSSHINSTGFSPTPKVPQGTGTCSYTINSQSEGALSNGTTYWWRVYAYDGVAYSQPGEKRSFTVNTSLDKSRWYQTTDAQFDMDTLIDAETNSDAVKLEISGGYSEVLQWDDGTASSSWSGVSFWAVQFNPSLNCTITQVRYCRLTERSENDTIYI
ncbi:hypothetical protein DRQ26_05960, partial [bacterium]